MGSRHAVSSFVHGMIVDKHAAEDVLQMIAVAANTHYSSYDPSRPFTPWLIGIAKREVALHYRKINRDRHIFDEKLVSMIADTHVQMSRKIPDRIVALESCIQKLNSRGQAVINLRYTQDLTPQQIAEDIGSTATAINSLLHRLRVRLQECIERQLASSGKHHD